MTLLPDIIEKFSDENTLVCGTGGFCDGKSIAAAFAMGADGVQMAPASSPPKRAISANCGRRWSSTAPTAARSLPAALSARHAGCAATCPCSMLTTPPRKPCSYVGVPDDFSSIPMELLTFERHGVAATYKGDVEHAMAGAASARSASPICPRPRTWSRRSWATPRPSSAAWQQSMSPTELCARERSQTWRK